MEITVNAGALARELGLASGAVDRKSTIPILGNYLLVAEGKKLHVTATDLEMAVVTSLDADVSEEGRITIPARKLLDYVRLLPGGDLSIKPKNNWATLTCGRSKTRIAGMGTESFPELPAIGKPICTVKATALFGMFAKTGFCVSTEESRFTLNGCQAKISAGAMAISATDGHRLCVVELQMPELAGIEPVKLLIPRRVMVELPKLPVELGGTVSIFEDDNHLFFKVGDRMLIARRLSGNFPDIERVMPKAHTIRASLNRKDMIAALERVMGFANERSHSLTITIDGDSMGIKSSLADTGEAEESLNVSGDLAPITAAFNGKYLLQFLASVPTDEVLFLASSPTNAGEMQPNPSEPNPEASHRYVVMPMRI